MTDRPDPRTTVLLSVSMADDVAELFTEALTGNDDDIVLAVEHCLQRRLGLGNDFLLLRVEVS